MSNHMSFRNAVVHKHLLDINARDEDGIVSIKLPIRHDITLFALQRGEYGHGFMIWEVHELENPEDPAQIDSYFKFAILPTGQTTPIGYMVIGDVYSTVTYDGQVWHLFQLVVDSAHHRWANER